MAKKKHIIGTCPYCLVDNVVLETEEHVIPRSWFVHDSHPYKKSIKIDTCKPCNNTKSLEDSWMRNWLATIAFDKSEAAEAIMMGKVKRSVENGTFRPQFQAQYEKITLVTELPDGTKLPDEIAQIHVADDMPRAIEYVDQVVRGLYAYKNKAPLPSTHGVRSQFANDQFLNINPTKQALIDIISPSDWEHANSPVFSFTLMKAYDSDNWVCITVYYGVICFMSMIGTHEWIKERDAAYSQTEKA